MTYRQIAINKAKVFEGLRLRPYKCPAGYWTIGYGYNLESHGLTANGKPLTFEIGQVQADLWLAQEMDIAEDAARAIYSGFNDFPDAVKALVMDLAYNMGEGTLRKFVNTNAALNNGQWELAAAGLEASRYYRQTGNRAKAHVATLRGLSRS